MTTRSRSSLRCSDNGSSLSCGGSVASGMVKWRWPRTIKSFVFVLTAGRPGYGTFLKAVLGAPHSGHSSGGSSLS
jgi:hypothetical protein